MIVDTVDGATFRSGRIEALWEPPDTLPSDVALETKFRWLTAPVIGARNADVLLAKIWKAEQWASPAPIIEGSRITDSCNPSDPT